jgi:hypothetical protein
MLNRENKRKKMLNNDIIYTRREGKVSLPSLPTYSLILMIQRMAWASSNASFGTCHSSAIPQLIIFINIFIMLIWTLVDTCNVNLSQQYAY